MLEIVNRRVLLASMLLLPSLSTAAEAAALSTSQLNALLKDPGFKVSATSSIVMGTGPIVTVLTEEDAKTADQDLKIDALFLSKTLMEAAPGQIEKVKVLFSQSGHSGRFIIIDNREIQDFGHGKISPEKMLASLRFSDVEPERAPDVVPGPEFERRLLAWNRIKRLRQQGTGVGPFENIFREIENVAKSGESAKVSERVAYLESKLSDQEEQVKQAKKSAQGRGVPSIASRSSVASTPAGSGSQSTAPAGGHSGFVPPDAERIKRIYTQDSESWLRNLEAKNSSQAETFRKMKKSVDEKFATKQDAAAFEELSSMITLVKQDLGFDPFRPDGDGGRGQAGGGPNGGGPNGGGPNGGGPNGGGPNGGGGPMGGPNGPGGF